MKKLQIFLFALAVGLTVTSCSKDDTEFRQDEASKASISFGAILQDMETNRLASKQALDEFPVCTNDEVSYVRIILSKDGVNVVGSQAEPFRIDLVANQIFTQEVPELELSPGTYSLDYFGVYNAGGDLIWLAPNGGIFTDFIDNPLPLAIELNAGVKKYIQVSVLCFDNRFVNEYGYLFFDLNPNRAIEFCIFGNYCDETGRHYPAAFSVDIWAYSNGAAGAQLYSNVGNTVAMNDAGDYAGTPLCIALPNTAGLDEYYIEISLLNSDAYGNVTEGVIRSGVITDEDVRNLFDGDDATDYFHFREGVCNLSDSPDLFGDDEGQGFTRMYDADVATQWFSLLADLSKNTFYFPLPSARLFAYSGLALYESVVPGMPDNQSIFYQLTGQTIELDGEYFWPATANAAQAELARKLLQDYPQPPNLVAINQLEADLMDTFPSFIPQEQLDRSVEFGKYVAGLVYEWSKTDGFFTPCPPYIPLGGPGNWEPTPPMFFPAAGSCLSAMRTFVPNIAQSVMPGPPPAYSTDPGSEFYQMNVAVYETTQNLTAAELNIIQAWRDNPPANYNGPAHVIKLSALLLDQENANLEEAAVLFAKQGIAIFDAIPSMMTTKYEYVLLRPTTYIRGVLGHTTWESVYPAPPHPSYPAIAPGVIAAAVEVLEGHFGTNYAFVDATQEALYGIFSFGSFSELLQHVGISRTHSGINYQLSVDTAIEMGRTVGEHVNAMNFEN
ncbi:MAG: hypothetical protein R6W85_07240 [Gillisia sp.]